MNRNTTIVILILLFLFFLRSKKGKKISILPNDDVYKPNCLDTSQLSLDCLSKTCLEKYDIMECKKQEWINFASGLSVKSSQNDTAYRGKRNEYLFAVNNFLACLYNMNNISPKPVLDPGYGTAFTQYTQVVASNIVDNEDDPVVRYDPYNDVAHWNPTDQYYLPYIYQIDDWILESANDQGLGQRGTVFDFSDIEFTC